MIFAATLTFLCGLIIPGVSGGPTCRALDKIESPGIHTVLTEHSRPDAPKKSDSKPKT